MGLLPLTGSNPKADCLAVPEALDSHGPQDNQRPSPWSRLFDPVTYFRTVRGVLPRLARLDRDGESIVGAAVAIAVAIALQYLLPDRVTTYQRWVFPTVALLLLIALVVPIAVSNGGRINRPSPGVRLLLVLTVIVMAGTNTSAAVRLVHDLFRGQGLHDAAELLATGGAIWLTNVIIFALVYWMFDRGGPAARFLVRDSPPDLLFPQHTMPDHLQLWAPVFFDYLYTSFTSATAFSPTDVMPLSRWVKLAMMIESSLSLVLAIVVVARAVNVL